MAEADTKVVKDGGGVNFLQQVVNFSGTPTGPFSPVMVLADGDGNPSDIPGLLSGLAGLSPSGKTPITGTLLAQNAASAAFTPIAGRAFNVSITANGLDGTVRLERSFDAGATWLPITAGGETLFEWTASASEVMEESEAGVTYRVRCVFYQAGSANYRISQ